MNPKLFKILVVLLAVVNLGCSLSLAYILFQQVSDENLFTDLEPCKIIVIYVVPGGASDRAGLKLDDIIVKINHQTFEDKYEADAIMRDNEPGSIIQYDIIRDGQPMKIFVQLARLKVQLYYLFFAFCGILLAGLGLLVGLRRAHLFEARIYALGLLAFFPVLFSVGRFTPPLTSYLYLLFGYCSVTFFFGLAALTHSRMYFPIRKFEASQTYAHHKYYYLAAGLCAVFSVLVLIFASLHSPIFRSLPFVLYLLLTIPLIIYGYKKARPEYKKVVRRYVYPFKIFIILCFIAGSILLNLHRGNSTWGELFLISVVFIPFYELFLAQKFHTFNIYFVIKRTGLYRLANIAYMSLSVVIYILLVNLLSRLELNLPTIYFHAGSIEFLWSEDIPTTERLLVQKATLLGMGIGLAFFLYYWLHQFRLWVNKKFYREKYDYKRALSQFLNIMPETLDIKNFLENFLRQLISLMHLKVAVLIYGNGKLATSGLHSAEIDWLSEIDLKLVELSKNVPYPVTHCKSEEIQQRLKNIGVEFIVPVVTAEQKMAAILLCGEKLSESNYNQEDIEFLQAIANYILISLNHLKMQIELQEKQRIEDELCIARKIQLDSLPKIDPSLPHLETSSFMQPALEVGGDYFDYFQINPTHLGIIVGDVSGKGTSAALYVAKIQGIIRSLFPIYPEPKKLFKNLNYLLYTDTPKNTFFTAIATIFDTEKARLKFVRAGHSPMIYFEAATGKARFVQGQGIGMGLIGNGKFDKILQSQTIHFKPDDIFVLYTDGLADMMNTNHEIYGEERVLILIEQIHSQSVRQIRQAIVTDLLGFKGDHQQHDDITLIVIKAK